MYSRVSSMLRGSGRMIQRAAATTTGSLPLSKSLLGTLLKRVSVSRRKVASFLAGTRNQSGHLTEFCRKCSLCFRSTAVSWSGNPAFSIKEIPRDSCSSTGLGTHRYSGDDSQSGRGTQANTYSDRTRPQGASSDTGEGSLERRLNRRQLYSRHAVDSEAEVLGTITRKRREGGIDLGDEKARLSEFRIAKETCVKPERLWREDLLLLKDGHCLRDHAFEVCRLADRRFTEGFEATSLPTLVQMVDNGLGTTSLPKLAVDAGLLQGTNLVTRRLRSHEAARKIGLVWRRGTGRRDEFRLLAKELMERAKLKSKSAAHQ